MASTLYSGAYFSAAEQIGVMSETLSSDNRSDVWLRYTDNPVLNCMSLVVIAMFIVLDDHFIDLGKLFIHKAFAKLN
ncbi:hypothetical protein [Butyrivibrio sp. WCE2006]|uniref:hypothetical protein n=1 Tax=Butyrivibrio sp. WCE2006 TaxID=1410611 RepID=UPI0018CC022F|nr:hypothetical protein [Butyrivibrio sp. WCE2006]